MSRGSELALLAGALLDQLVGAVVAFAPSGVAWCGFGPAGPVDAPAWTFRGAPIPYLGGDATPPPGFGTSGPVALRPLFERALHDTDAVRAAEIPVERARGPILLVSGEADAMWPSTRLGELVERRAAGRSGPPVTHLRYPGAGHTGGGVPGTPAPTEIRHPVDGARYALGGTPAANAAARADSWPQVLAFLATTVSWAWRGPPRTVTLPGRTAAILNSDRPGSGR